MKFPDRLIPSALKRPAAPGEQPGNGNGAGPATPIDHVKEGAGGVEGRGG